MNQVRRHQPPGAWRLLAPAVLVWAVAAMCIGRPGSASWVGCGAAVLGGMLICAAVCGVLVIRAALAYLLVPCAVLVVLCTVITSGEAARSPPELLAAANGGERVEAGATLRSFPERSESAFGSRDWVRAELDLPSGGVPVLLWLQEEAAPSWAPGTQVLISGNLERFEAASPAAFAMSVREVREVDPPGFIARVATQAGQIAANARRDLRDAAAAVPGAELVPGFAVGDTSLVHATLETQMQDSSLTHLTAVSGANCALVVGAIVAVASRLGIGRRSRIICAGGALLGFVVVVGPDASVRRAAIMATVLLISDFGGKRAFALPGLGVAMLVLLWGDPWQARQPGFTLSVAATGGILLLVPHLEQSLRRVSRLPRVVILPVAVAVAAQLSCAPLLLLLQEGIPAVGILANVIAAPAAPVGTGLGLLALLIAPWSPPLGAAAITVASWATRWVEATAEITASLPLARWHWPGGAWGAVTLAACELALLIAWGIGTGRIPLPGVAAVDRDPWRPRAPRPRAVRVVVAILISGAVGSLVAVIVVTPIAQWAATPRDWSVVACDVGQGDALLLRDPVTPDEVMLVDTGDSTDLLDACLDRFGIERIALLVLSHDDRDHVGAIERVLPITDEALIAPATREQQSQGRDLTQTLERARVPWSIGSAGSFGGHDAAPRQAGGLHWEVLAPNEHRVPADANAASLIMRVTAGGVRVLLLGDSGAEEHRAVVRDVVAGALKADVVKIAHHGSGDQDPSVLSASGAHFGLISVGAENGYGHPHSELLADLKTNGVSVLRTDTHGTVAIRSGETGPRAWVEVGDGR